MKRMSLAVAGLAAAVGAITAASAVPATAAGTARAHSAVVAVGSVARETVTLTAADLPVHRGKYWTRSGCMEAGQDGVDRGHWSQFHCSAGPVFWNLWTDR
jgi:hypothetical protein